MKREVMLKAFKALDNHLKASAQILIGGGAAMLLAYDIPLSTMDIDGLITGSAITAAELDPLIKKIGQELKINPHWFNSFFSTFTHTIPPDYKKRLVPVYEGKNLKVCAFGVEDLLIMKCFAGREKDICHARVLVRKNPDLKLVETHIERLMDKGLPGADKALEFLDELKDQVGL